MKWWLRAYGVAVRLVNARLLEAAVVVALLVAIAGPASAESARPRLLALGDSLTAGFGLPEDQAFPTRLQAWLNRAGVEVTVINAGVSGDTSAGGLARLDWALGNDPPEFALVELGANDALRGLSPGALYDNLDKIISRLQAKRVKVLLAGMYAPRNYGSDYDKEFDAVYPRLAKAHGVPLYAFFLDGVAGDPALNQADGLHPNPRGVDVIVDRLGPEVVKLIKGE
ncbi:MAG TPA: arylesterase [Alphaproteobacteria bacterium]